MKEITNVTCDSCVHYVDCMAKRIALNIYDLVPDVVNCDRYVRSVRRDKALDGKGTDRRIKETVRNLRHQGEGHAL